MINYTINLSDDYSPEPRSNYQ